MKYMKNATEPLKWMMNYMAFTMMVLGTLLRHHLLGVVFLPSLVGGTPGGSEHWRVWGTNPCWLRWAVVG